MTLSHLVLWHLRIFGPCSVADLIRTTRLQRRQVVGSLRDLRENGSADRCMRARYRITDDGRRRLQQPRIVMF